MLQLHHASTCLKGIMKYGFLLTSMFALNVASQLPMISQCCLVKYTGIVCHPTSFTSIPCPEKPDQSQLYMSTLGL